jgi:hypothetical protein
MSKQTKPKKSQKKLSNSHTVQLSGIITLLSLIFALPEVQAIIPLSALPYITALLSVLFTIRKYYQYEE